MKQGTQWVIATYLWICLGTFASDAQATDPNEREKNFQGEVRFRYDWIGVDGDEGRFREDNWITDNHTGGLDRLHLESLGPDEKGYEWFFEGRSLYDYDYDVSLQAKKRDSHYFKFDFDSARRYYDGSNEFWNQSLYGLPAGSGGFGSIGGTSEHDNSDLFVDRQNFNIELGLTPAEGPQGIFGWHRFIKDGKEPLLRGSQSTNAGVPNFRGIPAVAQMRGITDSIYGEASHTFSEKYNFRIRQEFEQYHDSQLIEFPRYRNGALDQYRTFQDDPGYTNWRTLLMFDSFLDEKNYVTANYMYDYLNNDTTRNVVRPNLANPNSFVGNSVGNSRRTNAGAFGYRRTNFLQVPKLDFIAGARVEDSRTDAHSGGVSSVGTATNPITAMSELDEVRIEETLRLVYKGLEQTVFSFDTDLEQRFLDWGEFENVTAMEIGDVAHAAERNGTAGVGGFLDRTADIDHTDQIYSLKGVHRFNRDIKSTVKLRYKDLERSYTEVFDNDPVFFPGVLGSYRRTGNDVTAKTDFRLNNETSTTLMYQFLQESINTAAGGKTSNFENHRGAGSLNFIPLQNMFVVATFMLENYAIDSPAFGTATNNASGSHAFDYKGNSYSLLLDGTYAFNEKTSARLRAQHTEALGSVDYAGDYVFGKLGLGVTHRVAANQTISFGYEFYNFNNHEHGSWDDYQAHGAYATYSYTF